MTEYKHIRVERLKHITVVRLVRPEVMNALSPQSSRECADAFDRFAADSDARVAVVTGEGDHAFCSGGDLSREALRDLDKPASGFGGLTQRFDLDKPVIAAVNGLALGGGFELALACDLIIAADHAEFGLPEPKIGFAALGGGLHRLPRTVGLKRAMGMILTARRVGAEEGKSLGFVHEVVDQVSLLDTAISLAHSIADLSPAAIMASKQAVHRGLAEASLSAAIQAQASYPAVIALHKSNDPCEGARAFREKRPPVWD